MVNQILLEILKRKIVAGDVTIEQVKLQEYKDALNAQ